LPIYGNQLGAQPRQKKKAGAVLGYFELRVGIAFWGRE